MTFHLYFIALGISLCDLMKANCRIYPSLSRLREVSVKIGVKVAEEAYTEGTASTYPKPANMEEFITSQLYDHNYTPALPTTFSWPGN